MNKENLLFLMTRSLDNINKYSLGNGKEIDLERELKYRIKYSKNLKHDQNDIFVYYRNYLEKYPRKSLGYNVLEYIITYKLRHNNGMLEEIDYRYINEYVKNTINKKIINKKQINHLYQLINLFPICKVRISKEDIIIINKLATENNKIKVNLWLSNKDMVTNKINQLKENYKKLIDVKNSNNIFINHVNKTRNELNLVQNMMAERKMYYLKYYSDNRVNNEHVKRKIK